MAIVDPRERARKCAVAMDLLDSEIEKLIYEEAWPLICALEGAANNTDTDPRWLLATKLRRAIGLD